MRPPKLSDAPLCVRWFNDPKVIRHLNRQQKLTLKDEIKFLRNLVHDRDNYTYSIINERGKHIGMSGFKLNRKDKRAAFGIVIGDKKEWGKKYGQEVTGLIIDFVFKKLKINRLELEVDVNNKAAVHVYKKFGFMIEGKLREYSYSKITKKMEDEYQMSILRKDWLRSKGR